MCLEINILKDVKDMMMQVEGVGNVDILQPIIINVNIQKHKAMTKDIYTKERQIMDKYPGILFDFQLISPESK